MANRLIAANLATAGCAVCTDANGMLIPYTAGGGSIMIADSGCNSTIRCGVNNCVTADYSFAGGGQLNRIMPAYSCVTCNYTITCSDAYGPVVLDSSYGDVTSCFPLGKTITMCLSGSTCNVVVCGIDYNSNFDFPNTTSIFPSITSASYLSVNNVFINGTINSSINGGCCNSICGSNSFIGGGSGNTICGINGLIGGGICNQIFNNDAFNTAECPNDGIVIVGGVGNNTCGGTFDSKASVFTVAPTTTCAGRLSFIGNGIQNRGCGRLSFIGNGSYNLAAADYSFIGNGSLNNAQGGFIGVGFCNRTDSESAIVVGNRNTAASRSFIGAGNCNISCATDSVIVGGCCNRACQIYSFIGTGAFNTTCGNYSFVGSGNGNTASGNYSAVLGGQSNSASANFAGAFGCNLLNTQACSFMANRFVAANIPSGCAVCADANNVLVPYTAAAPSTPVMVAGSGTCSIKGNGCNNVASGSFSFVGGGNSNTASGYYSFVGSGQSNTASGAYSFVGGGQCNKACWFNSTVGGGYCNIASGYASTISGGYCNNATNSQSTIAGGSCNTVSGQKSFIGSGFGNTVSSCYSSIVGGGGQYSGRNTVSGKYSAILGGEGSTISNARSFIIGSNLTSSADCTSYHNAISKTSGTFRIPHPDPSKTDTKYLQHSFVESPTRGDNIYRFSVNTIGCNASLALPDYYKFLNENDQVWISPVCHFGSAYGVIDSTQSCVDIISNCDGAYNVLVIGTRKDEDAKNGFLGVEIWK